LLLKHLYIVNVYFLLPSNLHVYKLYIAVADSFCHNLQRNAMYDS